MNSANAFFNVKAVAICLLLCTGYTSCKAQKMKSHLHQLLTAKVAIIYEETPDSDPCAGAEVYLAFLFDETNVTITEHTVSSCNKETNYEIGTYTWNKSKETIQIDVDPVQIIGAFAENLSLTLRGENMMATITHLNGTVTVQALKKK